MATSDPSEHPERRAPGGRLAVGLVLVFLGLWLGLEQWGVPLPDLGQLWPAFPFLVGCAFLVAFFVGDASDPGLVFPGTMAMLLGLFFALFTLGPYSWYEMSRLWPVFPLVVGVAFVATWVAGRGRQVGLLVPAALGIATGVLGLALTHHLFEELLVPVVEFGWPLVLIGVGVFLVWRSLKSSATAG